MDLTSYTSSQIDLVQKQDFCVTVKQNMSSYANAFASCKQSIIGKTLVIRAELDVNKIEDKSIRESTTLNEIKESLEKVGYSCTY